MGHICGNAMERNLTKIVERVHGLATDLSMTESARKLGEKDPVDLSGLFIAVSRDGVEVKGNIYIKHKEYADENLRTLNILANHENISASGHALKFNYIKNLPVFECGGRVPSEYYKGHSGVPDHSQSFVTVSVEL
jgi:hypothetical protein